jgi:hypothetical protein
MKKILFKEFVEVKHKRILTEGGNVFKEGSNVSTTQRIRKQDVNPTIKFLEDITGLPLSNNKLGTTGLKETSGDLDLAVDAVKVSKDQLSADLMSWVEQNVDPTAENLDKANWVKKSGINVHFKTPIRGDISNGFVQTDFMFGDPEWLKFTMKGSIKDSEFKGMHRAILLSSLAKANGLKMSPKSGLVDRETDSPIKNARDPKTIAKTLLGSKAEVEDIADVESIMDYLRKHYKTKDPEKYQAMIADAEESFGKMGLSLPK